MNRSQRGLAGAGEWPALQALLPDFEGKTMVDLGCGYGWHCRYASDHGARQVIGVDLSAKMLTQARSLTHANNISYRQGDLATVTFPGQRFDLVFSSLALHYLPSFDQVLSQIEQYLQPGGQFIFSVEHPLFTASGQQDWIYRADGVIDHFPVDRYFDEGPREVTFLGTTMTKYHRTLTTYLEALLAHGFQIEHVVEPQPPQALLDQPGMRDEFRRPMMLLISARLPVTCC